MVNCYDCVDPAIYGYCLTLGEVKPIASAAMEALSIGQTIVARPQAGIVGLVVLGLDQYSCELVHAAESISAAGQTRPLALDSEASMKPLGLSLRGGSHG